MNYTSLSFSKKVSEIFTLTIDGTLSIGELITAGKYDVVTPNFLNALSSFRLNKKLTGQKFETCILQLNFHSTRERVNKEIAELDLVRPWKHAKLEHLLTYGISAKIEEEQFVGPVTTLGYHFKELEEGTFPRRFDRYLVWLRNDLEYSRTSYSPWYGWEYSVAKRGRCLKASVDELLNPSGARFVDGSSFLLVRPPA